MATKTLNQIRNDFRTFAVNHLQIENFFFGHYEDATASGVIKYPNMVANYVGANTDDTGFSFDFEVIFEDLTRNDELINTEVLSDTTQYAQDLLSYLFDIYNRSTNDYIVLQTDSTIEPFTGGGTDITAGVVLKFTLRDAFDYNKCQVPITQIKMKWQ